jgi:hypothetical protein
VSYVEQWKAIAARIRSLRDTADLYAQFLIAQQGQDSFTVGAELVGQSRGILDALGTFRESFAATLPPDARASLDRFLNGRLARLVRSEEWTTGNEVKVGPIFLTGLESEISFLLSDTQESIRARSERAFLHLQRLLAVDADVRSKWNAAFEALRGEEACEKLGGVHLLWHGIFAFKVQADRATTDLVFEESIDPSVVQRGIEGLVLTEWKIVNDTNAVSRFDEARRQAELYQRGPLAGSELTGYRYAIAVSRINLPKELVPDDRNIRGVIYRHINIAIEPRLPSEQARADSHRPTT